MSEPSIKPAIFMSEVLGERRILLKINRYRFAAATRFTISSTAFHVFRMTGRFANLAGIFPLCFTNDPYSEMARMDTYVRFVPFPY